MKNLKFNKEAIGSLILAGSIALTMTGCGKNSDKESDITKNTEEVKTVVHVISLDEQVYIDKSNHTVNLNTLNDSNYKPVGEDNKYTLFKGANIYFKAGNSIIDDRINEENVIVNVLETNDSYAFIVLPNKERAYVSNDFLIKCANLQTAEYQNINTNNESMLEIPAYLYDQNGMYICYLEKNQPCIVNTSNGEYSLITLPDGTTGYVQDKVLLNNYQIINGYAIIEKGFGLYLDKNLTNLYRTSNDEMAHVTYISNRYANVFIDGCQEELYVDPTVLDGNFILINLNEQRMYCYLDYKLDKTWCTRTGNDKNPTDTGTFNIGWKATNWEFPDFPDCKAKHIIFYNQNGEAIHDLVGDDEANYGNSAYHRKGTHGCARVTEAASEYVYEYYDEGDYVLVRSR